MKRTALALTLALTLLISSVSIVPPARSTPRTIIVPDNFATIPEAVRNATAGDTVYVRAGNYTITSEGYTSGILYYFVGLAIDTPISLIGENCSNTVISIVVDNPTPSDIGIAVSADNVTISGFTIMGRNVVISLGGYSTLTNNIIKQTTGGSAIGAGYGSMVSSNIIEGAGYGTGIVANSYTNISNNIIRDFDVGIGTHAFDYNQSISDNTIANNNIGLYCRNVPALFYRNNVENCSQYSIYSETQENVNAIYNWWGTTDDQEIANSITTGNHVDSSVTFTPFLMEPNSQAVPVERDFAPPVLPSSALDVPYWAVAVVTVLVTAAIIGIGLLVYFKKRKR